VTSPDPQPDPGRSSRRFFQFLFVAWLIVVNVLYYAQFKALVLARLASLVHK
jgi:hypothetical protein